MEELFLAYLDIHGFSSFVKEDSFGALGTLNDYNSMLCQQHGDGKIQSFKHFIPMSDSIFITSVCPDDLIVDLSKFLISTAYLNVPAFNMNLNDNPQLVTVTNISKTGVDNVNQHWYPTFFRGYLTFGSILFCDKVPLIRNYQLESIGINVTGDAVVKAASIEKQMHCYKGPCLFCSSEFYNLCSEKYHDYFTCIANGVYEFNWTKMIDTDIKREFITASNKLIDFHSNNNSHCNIISYYRQLRELLSA